MKCECRGRGETRVFFASGSLPDRLRVTCRPTAWADREVKPAFSRPTAGTGHGYYLVGHHELMLPLLAAALVEGTGKP